MCTCWCDDGKWQTNSANEYPVAIDRAEVCSTKIDLMSFDSLSLVWRGSTSNSTLAPSDFSALNIFTEIPLNIVYQRDEAIFIMNFVW